MNSKKQFILKILLTLFIFFLISLVSTILLNQFGVLSFKDGIELNKSLFDSFLNTWYGFMIIILIQVAITSLLSFIPGASMAFIVLLQALYDNPVEAFFIAFSGVMLSSLMMYILGRYGGYSLCKKILGEEDARKAGRLLKDKGQIYFPMMMVFPIFPDDALVMIAGTIKMSLKWFIPSIVIGRGIGVATIVFGFSIVPFEKFTSIWHWVIFVSICAVLIVLVFILANKFNKYLENKKHHEQ
jgi:uncharacterized membrane protein YdjX (TVP38/TMEM64 family)